MTVTFYLNQAIESQTVPLAEAVDTLKRIASQDECDIFIAGKKVRPDLLKEEMLTGEPAPWIDLQPGLVGG